MQLFELRGKFIKECNNSYLLGTQFESDIDRTQGLSSQVEYSKQIP